MAVKKKRTRLKSLSQGRPLTAKSSHSHSSKATRTLIRTHHTLEKQRAKALASGDDAKAAIITKQIESQGGVQAYQEASLLGQTSSRGGDSSKILMEWLKPIVPCLKELSSTGQRLRLLEVGALSVSNACSKSGLFDIERIDLHSQEAGIKQQDFMARPIPKDKSEEFDILSLSLVLNYVPQPGERGGMLQRTLQFLNSAQASNTLQLFVPSLFLVLPAACVRNSRYLDEQKLEAIMESIGYVQVRKKLSKKLIYYLWRMESRVRKDSRSFKKEELKTGGSRNNFAILLSGD